MKWNRFVKQNGDYRPGEVNIIGDISGLQMKSSEAALQWDGMIDRADLVFERHPQDFLRTEPEKAPDWTNPEQPDVFTNGTNDIDSLV